MSPDRKLFFCRTTSLTFVPRLDKSVILLFYLKYSTDFPCSDFQLQSNSIKLHPVFISLITLAETLPFIFVTLRTQPQKPY